MKEKRKAIFHCDACEKPFEVEQGSRQRYCALCIEEKVKHKKPK